MRYLLILAGFYTAKADIDTFSTNWQYGLQIRHTKHFSLLPRGDVPPGWIRAGAQQAHNPVQSPPRAEPADPFNISTPTRSDRRRVRSPPQTPGSPTKSTRRRVQSPQHQVERQRASSPPASEPQSNSPSTQRGSPSANIPLVHQHDPTDTWAQVGVRGPGVVTSIKGTEGRRWNIRADQSRSKFTHHPVRSQAEGQSAGQPAESDPRQPIQERPVHAAAQGHKVKGTVFAPVGGRGHIKVESDMHPHQEKEVQSGEIATLDAIGSGPGTAKVFASVTRAGSATVEGTNPHQIPPRT